MLSLKSKICFATVIGAGLVCAPSFAGAATSVDGVEPSSGEPAIVQAAPQSTSARSFGALFSTDADELARLVGLASPQVGAEAAGSENARWLKIALALAGAAFLFRRRAWWRRAAYLHSSAQYRA